MWQPKAGVKSQVTSIPLLYITSLPSDSEWYHQLSHGDKISKLSTLLNWLPHTATEINLWQWQYPLGRILNKSFLLSSSPFLYLCQTFAKLAAIVTFPETTPLCSPLQCRHGLGHITWLVDQQDNIKCNASRHWHLKCTYVLELALFS